MKTGCDFPDDPYNANYVKLKHGTGSTSQCSEAWRLEFAADPDNCVNCDGTLRECQSWGVGEKYCWTSYGSKTLPEGCARLQRWGVWTVVWNTGRDLASDGSTKFHQMCIFQGTIF